MKLINFAITSLCGLVLAGCGHVQRYNTSIKEEQLTLAKVQREIKIGMSSSEVVEILGAPNMITSDAEHRETWVYDKVSTEISANGSEGGAWLLILGGGHSRYSARSNQKTLTIIVKFDAENKVRNFTYRASSF